MAQKNNGGRCKVGWNQLSALIKISTRTYLHQFPSNESRMLIGIFYQNSNITTMAHKDAYKIGYSMAGRRSASDPLRTRSGPYRT